MSSVFCIGHAVQDFVFYLDTMPARATKFQANRFESIGGGPAATAAVTISRLGGNATLAARLGDDLIADNIVKELCSYGIDCSWLRRLDGQSSLSAVIVDEQGERIIVNHLDRNLSPSAHWLPETLPENTAAVLADSRWPEGAKRGFQLANAAGIPAILDADVPVPRDPDLLQLASHVAFSADGLAEFSGADNDEDGLRIVQDRIDAWCCVTVGSRGTLMIEDDQAVYRGAFSVEPQNTLGAGDVWHGAFALAIAESATLHDAVNFAGAAAAYKVAHAGGRSAIPTRNELNQFLAKHSLELSA